MAHARIRHLFVPTASSSVASYCACVPLHNWEIDKMYKGLGDVLAAMRGKELNDIRRRDNLNYDDMPMYRPVAFR